MADRQANRTTAAAAPDAGASAAPALDRPTLAVGLFFASGAAGLLIEVAAVRAFLDLFGSTAASLGAVAAAFLVCLAIGALAVSARADAVRRPLRAYALLEAVACAGGLLGLALLPRLEDVAAALAAREIEGASTLLPRLLVCAGILIVPIGALGATLPLLARVRRSSCARGAAAGVLQAASTLGAMAGAIAGGAVLLHAAGTSATWAIGAATSGVVALSAILLARGEPPAEPAAPRAPAAAVQPVAATPPLVAASFLAGFTVLALEVLLFRGLGQVTRGGQETLSALLAAFLGFGALGTAIGVRLSRARAATGFVIGHLLAAATTLAAILWLRAVSAAGDYSWLRFGEAATTAAGRLAGEMGGAALVAGPCALATAIAFPCACELAPAGEGRFGRLVAWLSGAWTAGAALAGVIAPAWMLPRLGLRGALLACAVIPLAALALVVAARGRRLLQRRVALVGGGLAACVALALVPVAGGSALRDPLLFFRRVAGPQGAWLRAYAESPAANVAVVQRLDGTKVLAVNDQLALGGGGSARVERMQGVLPALLHPAPERALALGVGAGITLAGMRDAGCATIDAVELLPPVLGMLPWFMAENGAVVADPRIRFHATDARAFVRAAEPGTYDLIVGDLFFPWEAEAGLLYTLEHFERVKRLLKPDGIFCQWLPGHQLRWEEIGIVGRTFAAAFHDATLWLAQPQFPFPVLALVASPQRLEIDVARIRDRIGSHPARALLARLGIGDERDLLALYVADQHFFRERFEEEALNRADRAIVEFRAARRIESDAVVALHNRRRLYELHEDVVYRMTQGSLERKELVEVKRELSRAAALHWQLFEAQTHLLLAEANRELPPSQRRNDPEQLAVQAFQIVGAVLRDQPDHEPALELMAGMLREKLRLRHYEDVATAVTTLVGEESIGPLPRLLNLRGMARLLELAAGPPVDAARERELLERAAADFREAVGIDPALVEAGIHLGIALYLRGDPADAEEARAALQAARERIVAPDRPDGHGLPANGEAVLAALLGDAASARDWLERAALGPADPLLARIAARVERDGGGP